MSDQRSLVPSDLTEWTTMARRDDWHMSFVGSDIRCMLGEIASLRAQIASAMKALEGVYDHMDRNGMVNWPVAKRVRKELDSLTDEEGKS